MCEPISASLALTAAGTAAQVHGQRKAQSAMSNAQEAEAARQKRLREEGQGIFSQSLNRLGAENQNKSIAEAGKARGEQMASVQSQAPVAEVAQQGGTPKIISDETASRVSNANTKTRQQALAQGFLGGYGDVNLSNALQSARSNQGIGVLNNFRQGSLGVLSQELENASHAGDKYNNIGAGLKAIGALVGMYGAMAPANAATSGAASGANAGTMLAEEGANQLANAASTSSAFNSFNPANYSFINGSYAPLTSTVPSFIPAASGITSTATGLSAPGWGALAGAPSFIPPGVSSYNASLANWRRAMSGDIGR